MRRRAARSASCPAAALFVREAPPWRESGGPCNSRPSPGRADPRHPRRLGISAIPARLPAKGPGRRLLQLDLPIEILPVQASLAVYRNHRAAPAFILQAPALAGAGAPDRPIPSRLPGELP